VRSASGCSRILSIFSILYKLLELLHNTVSLSRLTHPNRTMSSDIPSSCRAVVLDKVGAPWTIKEVPVSKPESGEVLIKVLACGVCHSDSFLHQGHLGDKVFPRVPGHEVIGTVIAVGDGEKKWKVGDCVGGGWHGGHDGLCKACNRGLFQMCENEVINGVSRDGGCEFMCFLSFFGSPGSPICNMGKVYDDEMMSNKRSRR